MNKTIPLLPSAHIVPPCPHLSGFSKRLAVALVSTGSLLLFSGAASGQLPASTVHTGAPPAWVEHITPDAPDAGIPKQAAGGQIYDLIDTQINFARSETCIHVAKEITSAAGVQSGANLEFDWDPSYQELIIHRITILRGTERLDRLDLARFKIIQQEADLNRQIYNGALSAVLFLEDVRTGDKIEYEYTLRGQNPSLRGSYSDMLLLGGSVPVQRRHIRLIWPADRQLNFAVHGIAAEPVVKHHDGVKEYLWDLHELPAVMVEDQIPSWFTPYPWIQLSDFADWPSVAIWATGLYVTTNLDAPELKAEVASLKQPGATAEQIVQDALEFVQSKVRYLGIEFGPNSYRPSDPAIVLQRRFGDCKDKAFLLCTLLRGLGYDASPVLVATGFRQALPNLLPAPNDFDHVIVRAVAGGNTYWLDPTRSYQHGPLAQRYQPPYAYGLLVKLTETALTTIPVSNAGAPSTITIETFRLGQQKGLTGLNVTTIFNGFDAEWMRAILDTEGRERLVQSYLNDYAQRYPGVTASAPMVVDDAANADRLTLNQAYTITNFWVLSNDKQRYDCQFYPQGIHGWITKPATTVRTMPMECSFPRLRSVQTKIILPTPFKLSNFTNTIEGPAARLHVERSYEGQTVWLKYDYIALTNFVPVSSVAEHLASLDRMENALGYSLKWQNMEEFGATSQFNLPIFLLAMIYATIFAGGAGILCFQQGRRSKEFATTSPPPLLDQRLNGLGGWLILPCLGLIFGSLRIIVTMTQSMGAFSLMKWHSLTSLGGVSYHPLWGPLLTFELLGQISILILDLFLLVLFFRRHRLFPRWFIALMVLNALFVLGDMLGTHSLGVSSPGAAARHFRNIASVVGGCGIWIPYMLVSKRVKATFVR